MKTYKPILLAIIFIALFSLILSAVSLYGIICGEKSLLMTLFEIIIVLFAPVISLHFAIMKINLDKEKVEVRGVKYFPGTGSLNWNEITEVRSEYVLFPETGVILLIPKTETAKKFIRFSIMGMPIELIRDILANVPKDTKVYLYPYLKRRAEGKQIIYYNK